VFWVAFETPFFTADKARKAATLNRIPLTVVDITDRYIPMLKTPPGGYGKYMNPCMDCHALMFRIAGEIMLEKGYDFLFSGEVMGQRPMSQTKNSLRYVEKHSGFDGYILRPLSAKVLPETPMERNGLVDRKKLCDFYGRSRKPQIDLAKKFNVTDYPAPAGGCLLADKNFSIRLSDLFEHQKSWEIKDLNLLKYGRHIRLDAATKIIIGRNQLDNEKLMLCYRPKTDVLIKIMNYPGPLALIPNGCGEKHMMRAASICAGYSRAPVAAPVEACVTSPNGTLKITVTATPHTALKELLIP
jgi:tRNA U34 2-thiouridine synthase MnmA/TrmU